MYFQATERILKAQGGKFMCMFSRLFVASVYRREFWRDEVFKRNNHNYGFVKNKLLHTYQ